jgi:hypothetical protein
MTIYLPKIVAADFEAFRILLKDDIAPSFDEWLRRRREQIAFYADDSIVERTVKPDEFARFCQSKGCAYDARALLACAECSAKANP